MLIYTLEQLKELIAPIAEKHQLSAVYLFGSYARGTAKETSDVDLLVDTTGTSLTSLFALGALYCDLEDALQKRVDLITTAGTAAQRTGLPSNGHAGKGETLCCRLIYSGSSTSATIALR